MEMNDYLSELLSCVNDGEQQYYIKKINSNDIVFEERVKLNCFYCGKYNTSWRCPPKIPNLDYKKIFSEYENIAFVYSKFPFDGNDYSTVRAESSVYLHKALLKLEKHLWQNNNSTAVSFIGGSCKLCKNGCGKEKCNNPYMARTPLEATGVNVVKSAQNCGIEIKFPPKDYIMRLGMLLW